MQKKSLAVLIIVSLVGAYVASLALNRQILAGDGVKLKAGFGPDASQAEIAQAIARLPDYTARVMRWHSLPLGSQMLVGVHQQAAEIVTATPSMTAAWIKGKSEPACAALMATAKAKKPVSEAEFSGAINALKEMCATGLHLQDTLAAVHPLGLVKPDAVAAISSLAAAIKEASQMAESLAAVGTWVAGIKGQGRKRVQQALQEIDRANQKLERFAEIAKLHEALGNWQVAADTLNDAKRILGTSPVFKDHQQVAIARAMLQADTEKVDQILGKVTQHAEQAYKELSRAERQESTVAGKATRLVGRLVGRAVDSRIAKEVAVSFKAMVLGTKSYYDLMEMDSSSNLAEWASRYQSDMTTLASDMDEIQKMDGWSLTGKNTFIESAVNHAHAKSFSGR